MNSLTITTLAERLREETKTEHAALEKAMMPLLKAARDKESYTRLLTAMYTYLQPVEKAVFQYIHAEQLPDATDRRTMAYMAADLKALDTNPDVLPRAAQLPAINNLAGAFGALYVLEGSTLGGQIVGNILRKNLPPALHHTRYFDSYGEETKTMWKKFTQALNIFGEAHPAQGAEIINAAKETFTAFQKHLAGLSQA